MLPRPKLVRAVAPDSVTQFVPFPTMKFPSVTVKAAMSSNWVSQACTEDPMSESTTTLLPPFWRVPVKLLVVASNLAVLAS